MMRTVMGRHTLASVITGGAVPPSVWQRAISSAVYADDCAQSQWIVDDDHVPSLALFNRPASACRCGSRPNWRGVHGRGATPSNGKSKIVT